MLLSTVSVMMRGFCFFFDQRNINNNTCLYYGVHDLSYVTLTKALCMVHGNPPPRSFVRPLVFGFFWTEFYSSRGNNCLATLSLPHKKKMMVDISLIPFIYFCLWTIHFKAGQDANIAKCVSNKLYPSQNGSSLEAVLANGSKSRTCANIPAATMQEHTVGAPTASADLAAQRASDREPAGTSGNQQHLLDR